MDVFKNFAKVIKIKQVLLTNDVFQLHCRVTALLLLGCSALVASKQHFGDPIDCITRDDVPNKIMDTYCWIHSTFTLPSACNKTVGVEVPHPCVDKSSGDREDRIYQKYYQWVYFVLFFQATCFYAPRFFWKMIEAELLSKLTKDFKNPLLKFKKEDGKISDELITLNRLAVYLADERNKTRHRNYFYYFTICELCNFINVILQIYLVDEFLGGTFTTYGLDVLNYVQLEQDDRIDPMVRIFPRMTKCTFHRFGASGDIQKYDALCILPLNIINEKIYIVMWFWFVLLAFITGLWLVYRLLSLSQKRVRYQVLRRRASLAKRHHLQYVLKRYDAGDWFLLSMICKNVDAQWFRVLVKRLCQKLHAQEQLENNSSPAQPNDGKFSGARDEGKELISTQGDLESGEFEIHEISDDSGPDEDDNIYLKERSQKKPEPIEAPKDSEETSKMNS